MNFSLLLYKFRTSRPAEQNWTLKVVCLKQTLKCRRPASLSGLWSSREVAKGVLNQPDLQI